MRFWGSNQYFWGVGNERSPPSGRTQETDRWRRSSSQQPLPSHRYPWRLAEGAARALRARCAERTENLGQRCPVQRHSPKPPNRGLIPLRLRESCAPPRIPHSQSCRVSLRGSWRNHPAPCRPHPPVSPSAGECPFHLWQSVMQDGPTRLATAMMHPQMDVAAALLGERGVESV